MPDAAPPVLGCESGHRFDVNKRGYVSLLPSRTRVVGDSAEMLDERAALLASGAYDPIREALIAAVRPAEPRTVLDSGTGTGWYLHGLLDALEAAGAPARGLASDLSPAAVQRAVRERADVEGLVADVHAPLPIRDAMADACTVVFAPRNPPEFARVLRPGVVLVIVVPRADHLAELRAVSGMLDVPEGKAGSVEASLAPWFSAASAQHVTYALELTADRARQLQGMGPSAHHLGRSPADVSSAIGRALPEAATVSVDVLAFTRR
ncbi:rRNA (guanine-N1)-methyltransferase [Gryllotalpicola daejeonensis]|uniref:rRNA (Guanine-N1)-methyltransferase n=2 Tax=Gryllotalpicola daejeonensis TaxID=993087 RepID=A0ABP7ZDM4_9MICO